MNLTEMTTRQLEELEAQIREAGAIEKIYTFYKDLTAEIRSRGTQG